MVLSRTNGEFGGHSQRSGRIDLVEQLSTRAYYSPELEFCRRSERGIPLPLTQPGRSTDQFDTLDGLSCRTSPSSETDRKSGGPPRKRVPVAVRSSSPPDSFCENSLTTVRSPVRQMSKTQDQMQWRRRKWARLLQLPEFRVNSAVRFLESELQSRNVPSLCLWTLRSLSGQLQRVRDVSPDTSLAYE